MPTRSPAEPPLLDETIARVMRACLTLLRQADGPASIRLRLSRDRAGVERLSADSFEGIRVEQLADALTRSVD